MTKQPQGGDKAPRSITPHKGGRTETQSPMRIRPEIIKMRDEIKDHPDYQGWSDADLWETLIAGLWSKLYG